MTRVRERESRVCDVDFVRWDAKRMCIRGGIRAKEDNGLSISHRIMAQRLFVSLSYPSNLLSFSAISISIHTKLMVHRRTAERIVAFALSYCVSVRVVRESVVAVVVVFGSSR